jgi:hypothetical protein
MPIEEPRLSLYIREIKDGHPSRGCTNDKSISVIVQLPFMSPFVWKPAHSLPGAITFTAIYPSSVVSIQLEVNVAFSLGNTDVYRRMKTND